MYMRKRLPNTEETRKFLDSLPKMYLVGCWAHYGVWDFPFSGKYKKVYSEKLGYNIDIPLVYQYFDGNGTCDDFLLREISDTTTGRIILWTQDGYRAKQFANMLEEKYPYPVQETKENFND